MLLLLTYTNNSNKTPLTLGILGINYAVIRLRRFMSGVIRILYQYWLKVLYDRRTRNQIHFRRLCKSILC